MAWGLTPDGLASFNKLVGVQHVLRPFELEYVALPPLRDPLLSGLSVRDVAMESAEQIFGWAAIKYMVDDEFTWIVDFDDIAPFCEFPNAKAGDHAAARKAQANWPRNIVNGFIDCWVLNYYCSTQSPRLSLKLPRPERINHFAIVLNTDYAKARKANLYFDDDPQPVVLTTKPDHSRQEFDLVPRQASRLAIELADFDKPANISGIDNVWIGVERSDQWRRKVKPLANIGGLVKYPMGAGGILLNQVLVKPTEANPVNAQKKGNVVTALLRNLHATYAGSKVLTTANLRYQPLPLGEHCNQYLSKDRGWFDGPRDLAHLPVGTHTLAGVPYVVRDFKTSPVPSCVMLAGPGAKGQLPKEVNGLPAGCKADVLFFLHAFNSREPGRRADARVPPPVAFHYVVHYADGQTTDVPVVLDEGVGHWISSKPAGLKAAALAWSARFPGDNSEEEAAVFQFAWTNPRADTAISSIDMAYGKDGDSCGTPVLLAVTAARAQ